MIKKWSTLGIAVALLTVSCAGEPAGDQAEAVDPSRGQAGAVNPLLEEWDTPFCVPPFDRIREEHYLPAIQEGMRRQMANIQAVVDSKTFAQDRILDGQGSMYRLLSDTSDTGEPDADESGSETGEETDRRVEEAADDEEAEGPRSRWRTDEEV